MMLLLKKGRVIDPANNIDDILDILIDNGKIRRIAGTIEPETIREGREKTYHEEETGLRVIPCGIKDRLWLPFQWRASRRNRFSISFHPT